MHQYQLTSKHSLSKKFYSSQVQRAGYRQNLEARKKLHKPELFFLPKYLEILIWLICHIFYSGTKLCLLLLGSA